jgi:antirestriction protein ArdC
LLAAVDLKAQLDAELEEIEQALADTESDALLDEQESVHVRLDEVEKKLAAFVGFDAEHTVPVLRYYNVFNVEQCDGIAAPDVAAIEPVAFNPIEAAELLVKGYADGPAVEHGGTQAIYRPNADIVRLPEPSHFASGEEYYSTLFHELSHSTGHSKRLDRKFDTDPKPFGSADYGREELVAEMSAAFLCAHAGITPVVIENQVAYLQGWISKLKGDKKLAITAAGAAQRSADWIRNERTAPAP